MEHSEKGIRHFSAEDAKRIAEMNSAINNFDNLTPDAKDRYLKILTPEQAEHTKMTLQSWLRLLDRK